MISIPGALFIHGLLFEQMFFIWIAFIDISNLVVKIFIEIVEKWAYNICWTVETLAPEALLGASVAGDVVAVSREVDSPVDVTGDNVDVTSVFAEFSEEFYLDYLTLVSVRDCF